MKACVGIVGNETADHSQNNKKEVNKNKGRSEQADRHFNKIPISTQRIAAREDILEN